MKKSLEARAVREAGEDQMGNAGNMQKTSEQISISEHDPQLLITTDMYFEFDLAFDVDLELLGVVIFHYYFLVLILLFFLSCFRIIRHF